MPKIAFLPVVILWLGVYDVSKDFHGRAGRDLPVVTATVIDPRVERELIWSRATWGRAKRELLWRSRFPPRLPQSSRLQVALPIGQSSRS